MTKKIFFKQFSHVESLGGMLLLIAAIVALIFSNTPLQTWYHHFFSTVTISIGVGSLYLHKSIQYWINDGLMVIFFLLVGLEIKRELVVGELNHLTSALLPLIAAVGGMIMPAIIYLLVNKGFKQFEQGWAIPTATDIAFTLAILSLLKTQIPTSLKVFLTALAILDDLGAIIIIAFFYTSGLSWILILLSLFCIMILIIFNRIGLVRFMPYAIVGIILWMFVLRSGIHATLAGIAIAFAYPLRDEHNHFYLPSRKVEKYLHPWVAYVILPIFAFANAGVTFSNVTLAHLLHPITLGILAGLFFGKPLGIFIASWIAIKFKIATLPRGVNLKMIYGVGMLAGVGFTMSLFIGGLAFPVGDYHVLVKTGVFIGSVLSAIIGYVILKYITASYNHKAEKLITRPRLP